MGAAEAELSAVATVMSRSPRPLGSDMAVTRADNPSREFATSVLIGFGPTKPRFPQGLLQASGPSEGSCVRRNVGASEFANSSPSFSGRHKCVIEKLDDQSYRAVQKPVPQSTVHILILALSFETSGLFTFLNLSSGRLLPGSGGQSRGSAGAVVVTPGGCGYNTWKQ